MAGSAQSARDITSKDSVCCGCGVCAGICPRGNLAMVMDEHGQYRPTSKGNCPSDCSLCLRVCPFALTQVDETQLAQDTFSDVPELSWRDETGFYGLCLIGHVAEGDFRARGASGGAASWLLQELLAANLVDAVACVRPTGVAGRLYEFCVLRNPEEVATTGSSAYYPVELSDVLREIRAKDGRYAIIGLPCVCKAVRLAMRLDRRLSKRIHFLLGLVCGHGTTAAFTDYLAAKAGLDARTLQSWRARVKDPASPAFNSSFHGADDTHEASVHWLPVVGQAWGARVLTPRACLFCDDIFAETADVAFMDAWLEPYIQDWRGTSIVLIRHPRLRELFEGAMNEARLSMQPVPVDRVVASQAGVVSGKRGTLSHRLWLELQAGRVVPVKRVGPVRPGALTRRLLACQARAVAESHALAVSLDSDSTAVAEVDRLVRSHARLVGRWTAIARLGAKLRRGLSRLGRKAGGA
jgi:coenzyme F420 hydrogenase subunit beta